MLRSRETLHNRSISIPVYCCTINNQIKLSITQKKRKSNNFSTHSFVPTDVQPDPEIFLTVTEIFYEILQLHLIKKTILMDTVTSNT